MYLYLLFLVLIAAGAFVLGSSERYVNQKYWIPWLIFSAFAVISIGFTLYVTATPWWGDFESAYYPSGYAVQNNPAGLYSKNCIDGFVNLPLVAVLFVPFSYLDYTVAVSLFTALGVLALIAACAGMIRLLGTDRQHSLMLCGLFVINGPALYSIKEANTSHFILLLLVGILFLIKFRKDYSLGALIVLGTLIKVPIGLLGIYFLLRRRWQVVSGMGVAAIMVIAASLLIFGLEPHEAWFRQCVKPYVGLPVAAFNVQSVDGFVARLFTENQLFNWRPQEMGSVFFLVRNGFLGILLLVVTVVLWHAGKPRRIEEEYLEFSIIICVLLLIFPLSWTHYYAFMLIPFGLYVAGRVRFPASGYWHVFMLTGIVFASLPMIGVPPVTPALKVLVNKAMISNYFLAVFLVLLLLLGIRNRTARKYSQSATPP